MLSFFILSFLPSKQVPDEFLQNNQTFEPNFFELRQVYEGMGFFLDSHIGTIVDTMKQKGLYANTLVGIDPEQLLGSSHSKKLTLLAPAVPLVQFSDCVFSGQRWKGGWGIWREQLSS